MKTTFALILLAAAALPACSRTKPEASVQAAVVGSARASEPVATTYPAIDANAKEGEVFEYY